MAFTSTPTIDTAGIGSGQPSDIFSKVVLSTESFEDGLYVGRFAKLDTGSIDNLDASATPTIAGVVVRSVTNPIEDGDTYSTDNQSSIEFLRAGLITVEVKSGQTPTQFGTVYAYNTAGDDVGKATTSSTGSVSTTAEFIAEVNTNIWLIRLK